MTSPVSHSCKWWSCHMAQGTQQTPASSLLRREKQRSRRQWGARCLLLSLASSGTTCSRSGAIKSVTPESGAAQACPQRAASANAILSRKLWGHRRHHESKPSRHKEFAERGAVRTQKGLGVPTTV